MTVAGPESISIPVKFLDKAAKPQPLNSSHAEYIKMPHLFLSVSQSDNLIKIFYINSHIEWQTVQIQISWLLTDLDLHFLQRQGISEFSWTRVNNTIAAIQNKKPS